MKLILGKKINMTQKFKADGQVVPVTVVQAGPCFITQVKNINKDGYQAIQLGYGEKKKLNKPLGGHLKDSTKARYLKELRLEIKDQAGFEKGQVINVSIFNQGDIVDVAGVTKGRGFQGVVKRHGFAGKKSTHGTKDQSRHSGSVGAKGVAHTFKGTRMGGRMGGEQVTIKNLEIIEIDQINNLLYIKGAIPGSRNGLLEIYSQGEMKLEALKAKEPVKIEEPVKAEKKEEVQAVEVKAETKEEKKEEPVVQA